MLDVLDRYRDILFPFLLAGHRAAVAGGAVADLLVGRPFVEVCDIDLFIIGPQEHHPDVVKSLLDIITHPPFELVHDFRDTDYIVTHMARCKAPDLAGDREIEVLVVDPAYHRDITSVVKTFDLSVKQAWFDGQDVHCTPAFNRALRDRTVYVNFLTTPIHTLGRSYWTARKYGFSLDQPLVEKLAAYVYYALGDYDDAVSALAEYAETAKGYRRLLWAMEEGLVPRSVPPDPWACFLIELVITVEETLDMLTTRQTSALVRRMILDPFRPDSGPPLLRQRGLPHIGRMLSALVPYYPRFLSIPRLRKLYETHKGGRRCASYVP